MAADEHTVAFPGARPVFKGHVLVVRGTRRRENPSLGCGHGFSGWSPEAVQLFKGLQADNAKAYWSGHKASCETSAPVAALPGDLSGNPARDRSPVPPGTHGAGSIKWPA